MLGLRLAALRLPRREAPPSITSGDSSRRELSQAASLRETTRAAPESKNGGLKSPLARALLTIPAVALTAAVARAAALNPSTTGFLFLLVVLFSATIGGLEAGIAASLLSTIAFNYFFLPPLHTFHVADPENWAALVAFLETLHPAGQQPAQDASRQVALGASGAGSVPVRP